MTINLSICFIDICIIQAAHFKSALFRTFEGQFKVKYPLKGKTFS